MKKAALIQFLIHAWLPGCIAAASAESHLSATPRQVRPDTVVFEAATRLPLAYDVDVVVAGGSLPGVEAACAAADQGATVLLVESRPYLGYDLCGTQRLWIDEAETPETPLTRQLFKDKRVVTPLEVKRALDNALLAHNVQFLTGTFPAELLVTEDGAPGGLTIVSRSGRQAIRAKVIIDATSDVMLARQSAAEFAPFKPGPKQCRFTVVGGKLQTEANEMSGSEVAGVLYESSTMARLKSKETKWGKVTKGYPVFEYTLPIHHDSDTFRSRSRALNHVRSLVYDSHMVDQSEHLHYLPDNAIIPAVSTGQDSSSEYPLSVFCPRGIENLYVLSAYAGKRWNSCSFAQIGRRIGVEAAKKTEKLPSPASLNYGTAATNKRDVAVAEVAPSFRFCHCPPLELAAHDLPVLGRWDVVVVGGGTSGAPAALGAARSGARTLVIEYLDELGGVGTAGLIAKYWYGCRTGFTAEIDEHLGAKNGQWSTVQKAEWFRAELIKNDAEIWFGSFGCGTMMTGDKVTGIVVATPFGRGVVLADVVIDSTGNADIAAAAGAGTHYSISALGDLSVQVAGYPDRRLGQHQNNTAYAMVSDCDVFDRWHLLLTAREHCGESNKNPYDMGQLIDTRDRRRIIGDYILTTEDILTQRTFPDTISHHRSNFDAGALPDSEMFLLKDMKGPVYTCDMPYRCLTPKGVEGLLVTGLGASTQRDAMTLTRMQPDLQNQGYAAGMAAAIAARETGGLVREIDLKELQKALVKNGCLEKRVLTDRDSFPMSDETLRKAVQTLHALTIDVHQKREYDDTLPALAVVMSHPERAIPLLKAAYRKTDKPEAEVNFARILSILGDATGKQTLLKAVNDAEDWGKGWDFSSQREHANSFGEVDRLVIALGFLRIPEVRPPLTRKLESLTVQSALSHYKAVCLALRLNKDKSLAQPLAQLLNKKGVQGHMQPLDYYAANSAGQKRQERHRVNAQGGDSLNSKFKEVLVAALLFECGDHNGQAREILEAYTTDVNGHFAAYAHLVLTRGTAMTSR